MTKGKFSTYAHVKNRHEELKKDPKKKDKAKNLLYEELVNYYTNDPKGRKELARSPHSDKEPEEVVALLLRDF